MYELPDFHNNELQILFILMFCVIAAVQFFIIFRAEAFKNAIKGLADSFNWTYINKTDGFILWFIVLAAVGVFAFVFKAAIDTEFRGANVRFYYKFIGRWRCLHLNRILPRDQSPFIFRHCRLPDFKGKEIFKSYS